MRPGEQLAWAIEWAGWLANRWAPETPFGSASRIRPAKSTGFQYVTSGAGLSGIGDDFTGEPIWPTNVGSAVVDGSLTWTCELPATNSLAATISASTWTADAGITVPNSSQTNTLCAATFFVAAVTADGDYFVRNSITLSTGEVKIGTFLVRVRKGKV